MSDTDITFSSAAPTPETNLVGDEYQAEFAIGYRDGYSDGLKDGAKTAEAQLRYISTQWPGTSAGNYARAALASTTEGSADGN